jgi:hypothetical protein
MHYFTRSASIRKQFSLDQLVAVPDFNQQYFSHQSTMESNLTLHPSDSYIQASIVLLRIVEASFS